MKIESFVAAVTLIAANCSVLRANSLCESIVGLLATEFLYKVPNLRLARVEIRQCSQREGGTIQLVAWRSGDLSPALIVNTGDFGVVQTVARVNVFVVETGGATRDQVFVIRYIYGTPELAWKRITRGTARVNVTASAIDVHIEGIYNGDGAERTESQHFALDPNGMTAR